MDYLSTLSEPEQRALLACTQENPPIINLFLRGSLRKFYREDFDNFLWLVDVVYYAPPTTEEMIVYYAMDVCANSSRDLPLYHPGFIVASFDKDKASHLGSKALEITVPIGTRALVFDCNTRFPGQEEVLLPPGTLHFENETKCTYEMDDNYKVLKDLIRGYYNLEHQN